MSAGMAQSMEEIVRSNIYKPPKEFPAAMNAALGIVEGEVPDDFPAMEHLTRKVYTLRSKVRSEMK